MVDLIKIILNRSLQYRQIAHVSHAKSAEIKPEAY